MIPTRVLQSTVALCLLLGGCTLVNQSPPEQRGPEPGPEPAPEAVTRSFSGQFSVQGTSLPVRLTFTSLGESVPEARLTVPELDMEATGEGSLEATRLELQLSYPGDCSGEVRIAGTLQEESQTLRGTLSARDCTGEEEGGLVLRRDPGA